jgi:hypothetical protein
VGINHYGIFTLLYHLVEYNRRHLPSDEGGVLLWAVLMWFFRRLMQKCIKMVIGLAYQSVQNSKKPCSLRTSDRQRQGYVGLMLSCITMMHDSIT